MYWGLCSCISQGPLEKWTEHSANSNFMKYPYGGTPTTHQGVDGIDHIIVPSNSLNFSTIEQYGGVFSSFLKRSLNLCQIAQCTLFEPGKLGLQSEELMCMGAQSKNRTEAGTEESAAP